MSIWPLDFLLKYFQLFLVLVHLLLTNIYCDLYFKDGKKMEMTKNVTEFEMLVAMASVR